MVHSVGFHELTERPIKTEADLSTLLLFFRFPIVKIFTSIADNWSANCLDHFANANLSIPLLRPLLVPRFIFVFQILQEKDGSHHRLHVVPLTHMPHPALPTSSWPTSLLTSLMIFFPMLSFKIPLRYPTTPSLSLSWGWLPSGSPCPEACSSHSWRALSVVLI